MVNHYSYNPFEDGISRDLWSPGFFSPETRLMGCSTECHGFQLTSWLVARTCRFCCRQDFTLPLSSSALGAAFLGHPVAWINDMWTSSIYHCKWCVVSWIMPTWSMSLSSAKSSLTYHKTMIIHQNNSHHKWCLWIIYRQYDLRDAMIHNICRQELDHDSADSGLQNRLPPQFPMGYWVFTILVGFTIYHSGFPWV